MFGIGSIVEPFSFSLGLVLNHARTSIGGNGQHEEMVASNSPRERGCVSRTVKPLGMMISTEAGLESLIVSGTKVGGSVSTLHWRCFLSQL